MSDAATKVISALIADKTDVLLAFSNYVASRDLDTTHDEDENTKDDDSKIAWQDSLGNFRANLIKAYEVSSPSQLGDVHKIVEETIAGLKSEQQQLSSLGELSLREKIGDGSYQVPKNLSFVSLEAATAMYQLTIDRKNLDAIKGIAPTDLKSINPANKSVAP